MRRGNEWLCDTQAEPGCQGKAAVSRICTVEGREYALCRNCDAIWKATARDDTQLMLRCPICAPIYIQHAEQTDMATAAKERKLYRITPSDPVLTGPIADVVDNAMFVEGVNVQIRRAVLARLLRLAQADDSGYVGLLLAQTQVKTPELAGESGASAGSGQTAGGNDSVPVAVATGSGA